MPGKPVVIPPPEDEKEHMLWNSSTMEAFFFT